MLIRAFASAACGQHCPAPRGGSSPLPGLDVSPPALQISESISQTIAQQTLSEKLENKTKRKIFRNNKNCVGIRN